MSEKDLRVQFSSAGPLEIDADAALIHRMMANLFDNELKHLPPSCTVTISLRPAEDAALLVVEDDGPGFDSEISAHIFERRGKGRPSNCHGLGLAFVDVVDRAPRRSVEAPNRREGGARLIIRLPRATGSNTALSPFMAHASD